MIRLLGWKQIKLEIAKGGGIKEMMWDIWVLEEKRNKISFGFIW